MSGDSSIRRKGSWGGGEDGEGGGRGVGEYVIGGGEWGLVLMVDMVAEAKRVVGREMLRRRRWRRGMRFRRLWSGAIGLGKGRWTKEVVRLWGEESEWYDVYILYDGMGGFIERNILLSE